MKESNEDLGATPQILCIEKEICCNTNFRKVVWTGENLQVAVMSIPVGGEIGLEFHEDVEQILQIESGMARVYMGKCKHEVQCFGLADKSSLVIIPTKTWHNVINVGRTPLKLYSIYAPTQHPFGTIHKTKLDSDLAGD